MKRLTRTLLVGALVVAAAAITVAPAGAAAGGTDRPFKSTANGTLLLLDDPMMGECDFVSPSFLVCGQELSTDFIGTHLGRSTSTGMGELTIDLSQFCTTPGGNPEGFPIDSVMPVTTVAANGDELYAVTTVSSCVDGIGVTEPTGTYEITGGTGRFHGATGSGDIASSVLGSSISTTWTGTITY
jgi:hypothetical protein